MVRLVLILVASRKTTTLTVREEKGRRSAAYLLKPTTCIACYETFNNILYLKGFSTSFRCCSALLSIWDSLTQWKEVLGFTLIRDGEGRPSAPMCLGRESSSEFPFLRSNERRSFGFTLIRGGEGWPNAPMCLGRESSSEFSRINRRWIHVSNTRKFQVLASLAKLNSGAI